MSWRHTPNELWCAVYRSITIMKHIHETWAFLVKSGILRTSVYYVYGSQNEFVERVTRIVILRMRNLGQNGPLRRNSVSAVARIEPICGTMSIIMNFIFHCIQNAFCMTYNRLGVLVCFSFYGIIGVPVVDTHYSNSFLWMSKKFTLPFKIVLNNFCLFPNMNKHRLFRACLSRCERTITGGLG